jgi:hypothetical protein
MREIQLNQWNITKLQFMEWIAETEAEVYAVIFLDTKPVDRAPRYSFGNDEDFLAFKLKFTEYKPEMVGYKGKTTIDTSSYYCPYIPPK